MNAEPTSTAHSEASRSRNRRGVVMPAWRPDRLDRSLVELLLNEGRMTNAELARRVGLPESTCSTRVRALRDHGVLRGVHADIDLAQLDRPIEAMVAVRFSGHRRDEMDAFRSDVAGLPGVIAAYHLAGENDFLVHVCARTPHSLRDFVLDELTTRPGIAHAHTSLIFERVSGSRSLA